MSISFGPLAMSIGQLLMIVAFAVALITGALIGRRAGIRVGNHLTDILLSALLAARIGFVVLYFSEYQKDLLSIIDIRDGGFSVVAGLVGGLLATAWKLWRHRTRRWPLGIALGAGLVTWGLLGGTVLLLEQQSRPIPAVALETLNGQSTSLPAIGEGQPRVVNLWATWCPPCVREMPILEAAADQHDDITFVFANQGEHPDVIRDFLDEQALTLSNVLLDQQGTLGRTLGSQALPTTLFYNASGELVDTHLGALSRATLKQALERFHPQSEEP